MARPSSPRKRSGFPAPADNRAHRKHAGAQAPARDAEAAWGGAWLYGRHAVTAALANPARRVRRLVGLKETAKELSDLAGKAAARLKGEVEILDRARLEALLPRDAVHQGMALAAEPLPEPTLAELLDDLAPAPDAARQIVVLLDQVTDPHNVGAILRSAAAFGAVALVVPEHGAPAVTGALAKAASGALETVPLIRAANLAQALEQLKDAGFWCLGLAAEAPHELSSLDLARRIALVLGAEGEGLRRLTRERCDLLVGIAARHPWYSLNVSNAAAIALYEIAMRKA
jgi:23S rRNA (guanosine2251-2'-O)-methyltransferase